MTEMEALNPELEELILQACGAEALRVGERIQTLWGGYGEILRVQLEGCARPSVVVKHIKFPDEAAASQSGSKTANRSPPRWSSDLSHQRKVKSYQVETHWYQNYTTDATCRTPACLAARSLGGEQRVLVLEDLDLAGFDQRRTSVDDAEVRACLRWLARFHALFLGTVPEGLWPVGTYWHLETRPDELEAVDDPKLRAAAAAIDAKLSGCRFKTLVHGDAKLANFCFSGSGRGDGGGVAVAAVDFQYVGGGCGMKDVVYCLGSCLHEDECEREVPGLLDYYFAELKLSVGPEVDRAALEAEWRGMFAFAWTDFDRFLLGWMPGHWKISRYSKRLTREVLRTLEPQK